MATRNVMKTAQFSKEPCFVEADGEVRPYLSRRVTSSRAALAASLDIVFKHVADFHVAVVEIIAEKYNLDVEEMLSVIKNDSRYKDMTVDSRLNALGYFEESDMTKVIPPSDKALFEETDTEMEGITSGVSALKMSGGAAAEAPAPQAAPKKVKVRVRATKK